MNLSYKDYLIVFSLMGFVGIGISTLSYYLPYIFNKQKPKLWPLLVVWIMLFFALLALADIGDFAGLLFFLFYFPASIIITIIGLITYIKARSNISNKSTIKKTDMTTNQSGFLYKNRNTLITIFWIVFFAPLGIYWMWKYTKWHVVIKFGITAYFLWQLIPWLISVSKFFIKYS